MIRKLTLALMLSGSVLAAQAPAFAQTAAPVSKLVEAVNIPHEKFTLDNGLTVIIKEDHSAPVVSAQAWCRTGSINEGSLLGAGLSHRELPLRCHVRFAQGMVKPVHELVTFDEQIVDLLGSLKPIPGSMDERDAPPAQTNDGWLASL